MTRRRSLRSSRTIRASNALSKRWVSRRVHRILMGIFLCTLLPVVILRWLPPSTSAFMLQERASALLEGRRDFDLHYRWTDWPDISPQAALAVLAAEDQGFQEHYGFDVRSIRRAMQSNRQGRPLRGGSTISQQTAKNLFLYAGKSFWRKGLEAYFTVLLEGLWPKRRILEVYLNIAQFGRGIYGIGAASERYFHKPAAKLSAAEAALLAATLPNPLILRADKPSTYVLKRRQWIQRQMGILARRDYLSQL